MNADPGRSIIGDQAAVSGLGVGVVGRAVTGHRGSGNSNQPGLVLVRQDLFEYQSIPRVAGWGQAWLDVLSGQALRGRVWLSVAG